MYYLVEQKNQLNLLLGKKLSSLKKQMKDGDYVQAIQEAYKTTIKRVGEKLKPIATQKDRSLFIEDLYTELKEETLKESPFKAKTISEIWEKIEGISSENIEKSKTLSDLLKKQDLLPQDYEEEKIYNTMIRLSALEGVEEYVLKSNPSLLNEDEILLLS